MPDRIFSVAFHPGGEKLVAGAGDKWGKVGRGSAKIFFYIWLRLCHLHSHFASYSGASSMQADPQVGLWDCLDNESETHGVHLFHYHSR